MALTPKRQAFAREYLVDFNAAAAARRAGYSERTAKQQGNELLQDPDVQAAIQQAQKELSKRVEISVDYVVRNLVEVVERCMARAPVMSNGEQAVDEDGNAVWTFNANGANKALELIGKHLGAFTEKVEMKADVMTNEQCDAAVKAFMMRH